MQVEEVTEAIKGHTEVNKNKIVKNGGKINGLRKQDLYC